MGSAWASGTSCSRPVGEDLHDIPLLRCTSIPSLLSLSATQFHPLSLAALASRAGSLCRSAYTHQCWPLVPPAPSRAKCQRPVAGARPQLACSPAAAAGAGLDCQIARVTMDSQPYAPWPTKQSPSPPSCSPPDKLSPPAQHTTPSTQTQTRRAVVRALLTTLACVAVGFSFGGLGLVALAPEPASGVSRALSRLGAVGAAGGRGQQQQHRVWKRQQAGGTAGQEYSTTTYADGAATSTFVKTTRPIVNPGAFDLLRLCNVAAETRGSEGEFAPCPSCRRSSHSRVSLSPVVDQCRPTYG